VYAEGLNIYIIAPLNVRKKSQLMRPINIIDWLRKEFHGHPVIPLAE